jgi:hypothetical protein
MLRERGGELIVVARFIPAGIVGHFEARSWPAANRASPAGERRTTPVVDLGARMRDRWRSTGT